MSTTPDPTVRPQARRVAVDDIGGAVWELLLTVDQKLFILRPVDETQQENQTLEILAEHMVPIAEEKGSCLGKKLAKALATGAVLPNWERGKFILVQGTEDVYGLKMSELVPFGKALIAQLIAQLIEAAKAASPEQAH